VLTAKVGGAESLNKAQRGPPKEAGLLQLGSVVHHATMQDRLWVVGESDWTAQ
jgi:hypothetical protein